MPSFLGKKQKGNLMIQPEIIKINNVNWKEIPGIYFQDVIIFKK